MVEQTDAIPGPGAMMIHFHYAFAAEAAVVSARRLNLWAFGAVFETIEVLNAQTSVCQVCFVCKTDWYDLNRLNIYVTFRVGLSSLEVSSVVYSEPSLVMSSHIKFFTAKVVFNEARVAKEYAEHRNDRHQLEEADYGALDDDFFEGVILFVELVLCVVDAVGPKKPPFEPKCHQEK